MLAEKLRNLRKNRGLTLDVLAREINIPASTLSRFEKNRRQPSTDMLTVLCTFFNCSADELLGLGVSKRFSPITVQCAELIESMRSQEKKRALMTVEGIAAKSQRLKRVNRNHISK